MAVKSIGLPRTQRFAASAATLGRLFGDVEPCSMYRGALSKAFHFDSRCARKPKISGPVVASLSVSRSRQAILQLYPVPTAGYSAEAAEDFATVTLPTMRAWLDGQIAKTETAVLGCDELVVEWSGGEHRTHELRYL